jgi:hypothetical protein
MTPEQEPDFIINGSELVHRIQVGQVHSAQFSQAAIENKQNLNYVMGRDVFLHVLFRPAEGILVLNDSLNDDWGGEFHVAVPAETFSDSTTVFLLFDESGLRVRIGGGESVPTGRWQVPGEAVTIKSPSEIKTRIFSHDSPGLAAAGTRSGYASSTSEKRSASLVEWVASSVQGASFAQIRATHYPEEELLSLAMRNGASQATMIDAAGLECATWRDLERRLSEQGLPPDLRRFRSADLGDSYFAEQAGSFDIVACRRQLQNEPDILSALLNLRRLTRSQCHVSAAVIPVRMEGSEGALDLTDAGGIFTPTMSDRAHRLIKSYFAAHSPRTTLAEKSGRDAWVSNGDRNPDCCWWAVTAGSLEGLAATAGFQILSSETDSVSALHSLILRPA